MGKYEPLAKFLSRRIGDDWDASFAEIEDILDFPLPPSARKHASWWGNSYRGNHSQAKGWIPAGWETVPREIHLSKQRVRFVRTKAGGRRASTRELDDLRARAMEISNIDSPMELERAALELFIRREAGKRLIALGGTMPDAWAPPRRRFE